MSVPLCLLFWPISLYVIKMVRRPDLFSKPSLVRVAVKLGVWSVVEHRGEEFVEHREGTDWAIVFWFHRVSLFCRSP